MFPWVCTFDSVTERKRKRGNKSRNYPCYLGLCKKIALRDNFFVLIFFGHVVEMLIFFSLSSIEIGNYIFLKNEIFSIQIYILKCL